MRKLIVPVILVVAVASLIGASHRAFESDSHEQAVVKTRRLGGRTILVNRRGLTLYHLSVERQGHFICKTAFCLSLWKPARRRQGRDTDRREVARHREASRRPAPGDLQGGPLYTFVQDTQARRHEGRRLQGRRHLARRSVVGSHASNPTPPRCEALRTPGG